VRVVTRSYDSSGPGRDTLSDMVKRSGRGTARQSIRLEESLWEKFGQMVGKDSDRSAVLRDFIRWYIGEAGAEPPKRPGR
jgi:hypothetical protein